MKLSVVFAEASTLKSHNSALSLRIHELVWPIFLPYLKMNEGEFPDFPLHSIILV